MQIKRAWNTLWSKSLDSINKSYPNLGAALPMVFGNAFTFSLSGSKAYGNKIFYSAENILVRKLTEAPITFSKKKSVPQNKFARKYYSKSITNENRAILKTQALTEVEDHPLNDIFDDNGYMSGIEIMEDFWHNYAQGDGFLYFSTIKDSTLSRNTSPSRVHSLKRSRITIIQSNDAWDGVDHYLYSA